MTKKEIHFEEVEEKLMIDSLNPKVNIDEKLKTKEKMMLEFGLDIFEEE